MSGGGDDAYGRSWERLHDLCRVLRGPDGCDWDRAQSPQSLVPYLIEELHEVVEALALGKTDHLTEEVGDALYLWVFFLAALEDAGLVSFGRAVEGIEEKLIRRHPHVFGEERATGDAQAHGRWEQSKRREAPEGAEILRSLPPGLSALLKARRLQEKAAAFGFDWAGTDDVVPKVREEIDELSFEMQRGPGSPAVREELGDLMFAVVNLARHLRQDPEATLLAATEKFRVRFNAMARSVEGAGHRMGDAPLDIMESHWQAVKSLPVPPTEAPPSDPR